MPDAQRILRFIKPETDEKVCQTFSLDAWQEKPPQKHISASAAAFVHMRCIDRHFYAFII
jgi:hypothetical protein